MSKLHQALLSAQSEMGGAQKTATNPHFRSQYADLESVQKGCFPQLHKYGIVVIQIPGKDETGLFLETMFIHGESGESVSNFVPVMMTKQDAQGYGSGLTYARRYGLMCLAGLAPTDDDGNAACEPVAVEAVETQEEFDPNERLTSYELARLLELYEKLPDDSKQAFLDWCGYGSVSEIPGPVFSNALKGLQAKVKSLAIA